MKYFNKSIKIGLVSLFALALFGCQFSPKSNDNDEKKVLKVNKISNENVIDTSTAESTAKGMLLALTQGDYKRLKAYAYIPKDANESAIKQMLKEAKQQADSLKGVEGVYINSIEYNKDKTNAIVLATILFNNGETSQDALALIKDQNRWVVGF